MPLIEIHRNPTERQLRQFGAACAIALPLLGWLWGLRIPAIGLLAAAGCIVAVGGWIAPRMLRLPFIVLSLAAAPVGIVVGEVALLVLFFGVFLPMGLLMRLARRDPLERGFEKDAETYWRPVPARDPASYFRQS
jgi:hypothetical protein